MTKPYRILITGSRAWTDVPLLRSALAAEVERVEGPFIIVHGNCPTGADRQADNYALVMGWPVERHPADWTIGKKAGPLRNQQMVDLGADVCIAFPLGESRGTRDCMRRAGEAGIPVHNYGDPA